MASSSTRRVGLHRRRGDGAFTVYDVNAVSLRQSIAPERMLGRVNAFLRILELGFTLAGTLAGGLVAQRFGLRAALTAGAAATIAAALVLLASPIRRLREPQA